MLLIVLSSIWSIFFSSRVVEITLLMIRRSNTHANKPLQVVYGRWRLRQTIPVVLKQNSVPSSGLFFWILQAEQISSKSSVCRIINHFVYFLSFCIFSIVFSFRDWKNVKTLKSESINSLVKIHNSFNLKIKQVEANYSEPVCCRNNYFVL